MSIKTTYDWYAKEGYINALPNGGLTLYNYANKTVFEGNWNYHTLTARGLILNDAGEAVARPWQKFFNMNERPEVALSALPKETPELSDKMDGSLIIAFKNPESGKWQAVTRGCWDNVQTQYANKWLAVHGEKLDPAWTYLFELVAPWNRIVVAYPKDEMILIGALETQTAYDMSYAEVNQYAATHGLKAVGFVWKPLDGLKLDDPSIVNQEGFVARFSNGLRVKLKYQQYMYLHKIITGLSLKGIWEMLSSGAPISLDNVPDEFMDWFDEQKCKIQADYKALEGDAQRVFQGTPKFDTRKEYAAHFTKYEGLTAILFRMLDGKDYSPIIWKAVKPEVHRVFKIDES